MNEIRLVLLTEACHRCEWTAKLLSQVTVCVHRQSSADSLVIYTLMSLKNPWGNNAYCGYNVCVCVCGVMFERTVCLDLCVYIPPRLQGQLALL